MRLKNRILLSVIICIGGIIYFFACKYTYDSKLAELKQKAENAFVEALNHELRARNVEGNFSFHFNPLTATAELPDSVTFKDESGTHRYRLDPKKHTMNITNDTNTRFLHTISFSENPLNPDSLNAEWNDKLPQYNIFVQSALNVSVTNYQGKVKSQATQQSKWCAPSNQIFTLYIGYACEIEVIGYLHYSLWQIMNIEILLYLALTIILIYGGYKISITLRKKFVAMRQKEIIEVPIVKVVQEVTDTPIRSYILHENIIFYAEQKKIEVNGKEYKVQAQTNQLLELFLQEKENYILEVNTIMQSLWPDGTGTNDRIHKAIARLRNLLRSIDDSIDIKRNLETYQLIL